MSQVAVIMPTYNAVAFVANAIETVRAQSFEDWELLCIDDGSTDATRAVIEAAAATEQRIRLIPLSRNLGAAHARNVGLDAASARWVAFLDADDVWLPDKLAIQVPVARSCPFTYTSFAIMNAIGQNRKTIVPPARIDLARLRWGNPIGNLTVMLDRAWLGARRFPLRGHEDYALWLRLLRDLPHAERAGDAVPLACYRKHRGSLSANKLRALGWTWTNLRREAGCSMPQACACLTGHAVGGLLKHYW